MKAVLIMGSESDMPHAEKITSALNNLGVVFEQHVASAHKNPEKVLEIKLDANEKKNFEISIKAVKELFESALKLDADLK